MSENEFGPEVVDTAPEDAQEVDDFAVDAIVDEEDFYVGTLAAIEQATIARSDMEGAYTDAFDNFAEVKLEYDKFYKDDDRDGVMGLVKQYGPKALKYFGAGGVGAGALLALAKDGTGAGILSKITGLFGFGG